MVRAIKILGGLGLAGVVLGAALLAGQSRGPSDLPPPNPGLSELKIRAFDLVDQDARPQTRAILDHGVVVLDFVFAHCPLVCPRMSAEMARVQRATIGLPVRLVSISLDPEHDTPEALRGWGTQYGADFSRWSFLTEPPGQGPRRTSWAIVQQDLRLHLEEDPTLRIPLDETRVMNNIQHPADLFLLRDGVILARYASSRPEEIDALIRAASALSR